MSWAKRRLRRLGRTGAVRGAAGALAGVYLRLIHRSVRWHQDIPAETRALLDSGGPLIVAFWHGRMVAMRAAWPGEPARLHMLISDHADGQVIAKGMQSLGFSVITGSSRRGGAAALRAMRRCLDAGQTVGITPDGPKGPRMRAKAGAIAVAQAAGVPIVPVSGATGRRRVLRSWDRFCLVWPFGRGVLLWGAPLHVPADAGPDAREAARRALEDSLNRLSAEADRRMGHTPVVPADPEAAPHERKRHTREAVRDADAPRARSA